MARMNILKKDRYQQLVTDLRIARAAVEDIPLQDIGGDPNNAFCSIHLPGWKKPMVKIAFRQAGLDTDWVGPPGGWKVQGYQSINGDDRIVRAACYRNILTSLGYRVELAHRLCDCSIIKGEKLACEVAGCNRRANWIIINTPYFGDGEGISQSRYVCKKCHDRRPPNVKGGRRQKGE